MKCGSIRDHYLVWLLPTSCDLLWRKPFLAPLCWFGSLTALLGCGRALLVSCTGSGTISFEVSFAYTFPTGTLLLWFGSVSLLCLLETRYLEGEMA